MTTTYAEPGIGNDWNPFQADRFMDQGREQEIRDEWSPACEVRVLDRMCDLHTYANDYISIEMDFKRNAAGALTLLLPGDSFCRDHIFNNEFGINAVIPIVVDTVAAQWTGKIDTAKLLIDENGVETIEITAIHDWEHLNRILMWPSPFAPLEAQWPRHMYGIGPMETMMKVFLKTNLLRLQLPLWRIPPIDELFNPTSWFNIKNAHFPVAVEPIRPFTDTSQWGAVSARMQTFAELFKQGIKDAGMLVTSSLFLPDEHEQPFPDFCILDRPTIVIGFKNKSGVTGPTGTLIDGLIQWGAELGDDMVTEYLTPIVDPDYDPSSVDPNTFLGPIQRYLGFKKATPNVVFLQGQYSGIEQSELALHKPMARDVIVGGKSPDWVNKGITLAFSQGLGLLGMMIGVPGLSSLYSGQLDDVFLAFQRFTDQRRAKMAGPYLYHEYFASDSTQAYTMDAFVAGRGAVWETRGYLAHKVTVRDHQPYSFGFDLDIGDLVGYELDGNIYTDYVTAATFKDDREIRANWQITIGDPDGALESPTAKSFRKLSALYSLAKDAALDTGADGLLGIGPI